MSRVLKMSKKKLKETVGPRRKTYGQQCKWVSACASNSIAANGS